MNGSLDNENNYKSNWNMYYGANPKLFELAQELRARMTEAEKILWERIKVNEWHLKFRRQHPLSNYIADFYCHQVKLVIELDGGYHENKEVRIYDTERENSIKEFGITVLRFKNEDIFNNLENVLTKINTTITSINNTTKVRVESQNNSPSGDGGKLFIIKIGGNVIDDEKALSAFLTDFASIDEKKILVHGGGKIATKIGEGLGIKANYINGRRITDKETIDLVTMVYGGLINKKIVAKLQALNCNAIGLTGADANIIPANKRPVTDIDFGFVGDINNNKIGKNSLELFLSAGLTPVLSPLSHDGEGQLLNTNADTIASEMAVAMSMLFEVRLVYCFEKKGVLEDVHDEDSVIHLITKEKYQQLLSGKKLFEGILPKIDNAFAAIDSGVKEVMIGDAKDLLQNCADDVKGTLFK